MSGICICIFQPSLFSAPLICQIFPGPEEERSSRHRAMRHPGHCDGHGERLGAGWDDPAAGARRTPGMGMGMMGVGMTGLGWGWG
jgi:hypothetical protein